MVGDCTPAAALTARVETASRPPSASSAAAAATMRSLDAIHLATAGQLGRDLEVLVTYDDRMAEAAKHIGHRVVAPR